VFPSSAIGGTIIDDAIFLDYHSREVIMGRLIILLVILAAVIVCYGITLRLAPATSPWERPIVLMGPPREGRFAGSAAQEDPGEYDHVTVNIDIPPSSEFPAGWSGRGGCPHMRICRVLGVKASGGGGVRIFEVDPGKPAANAGIQPGDRLGEVSECASSLYGSFRPRKDARTIEWTVRRPKGDAAEMPRREGSAEGGAG